MRLTIGFSPCPNDTFIFEAMINGRIDTEGIEYDWFLADVEELNHNALEGTVDITKISYHAYAYAASQYILLDAGGALGRGNGPLLISKRKIYPDEINDARIAIPGKYTTANLLLSIAWPEAKKKQEYLFSDIPEVILSEEADAGLIIHETRFTYKTMGLQKIADLGAFWEKTAGMPIPLGAIVVNRKISADIALKVNNTIRRSIDYASSNPTPASLFIKKHAREIEESVIKEHIKLYVNDFSRSLGKEGHEAVIKLYTVARENKIIPELPERIFLI
jgi:1,4-dihydroxy-6-naphthoate synthase